MRRLTKKEKSLAKRVARGESATEAARKVYDVAPGNANKLGPAVAKKPQVAELIAREEQRIQDIADKRLENSSLIEKHVELLHAQDPDGNPKYDVQQGALRDAYKLKKAPGFGTETHQHLHATTDDFLEKLVKKAEE